MILVNEEACIGCGLCRVHCQTEHSRSKNIIKAFKREMPRSLPRIRIETRREISFPVQCHHCAEPWCVYACLTGAMHRDTATGRVLIAANLCIGCWTCIVSCPYGALTRSLDSDVVVKCDLCPEQAVPVCVANCPNEALIVDTNGWEENIQS